MILARVLPHENRFALSSAYDKRLVEVVKSIPGMRYEPSRRVWIGYLDAIELARAALEEQGIAKVRMPEPTPSVLSLSIHDSKLRDYQIQGRTFLEDHSPQGALLADDLGLGKTRTALAAVAEALPAIIVCPNAVKTTWLAEAKVFGLNAEVLSGTKPKAPPTADVRIANYDIIHAWEPQLSDVKSTVFDECHNLSNSKSRRSEASKKIAHRSQRRIALSATPMMNRPEDLWNVIDTISPGRFGNFMTFALRYCNAYQEEIETRGGEMRKVWKTDGISRADELKRRMQHFMLRRTKQDVQLELPPRTRQIIEIDIGKKGRSMIHWDQISESIVMSELRQAAQFKIPQAVELAASHTQSGSSVVIFVYTKAIAAALAAAFASVGIAAYVATGDSSAKKREQTAESAKQNAPSVLIATLDSLGTGVNYLTYADVAIFCELHYVPSILYQAEGRLHRFGQKKNVLIQILVALGTIDEYIRAAVCNKLDAFDQIIGDSSALGTDLNHAEDEEDSLAALAESIRRMTEKWG